MALYELRRNPAYEVIALLTTVTEDYDRVSMHGVRRALLECQARSLGLPLELVFIPKSATNENYERAMGETLTRAQRQGVSSVAVGDISLEDLRKYREKNLARIGMKAVFPIWRRDTSEMARTFVRLGFKAVVTCVDTQALDARFAGREFDARFLADLPAGVDPCAENGEFHTFAYDGPIFHEPIACQKGETVLRDGRFCFCDLLASRSAINAKSDLSPGEGDKGPQACPAA